MAPVGTRVVNVVLATAVALAAAILATRIGGVRLPGNHQGYQPAQPIAFSHRLHAGELQVACQYCHSGAERSRFAGIPAAATCLNCHEFVTAPFGAVRAEDEAAQAEGRPARQIVSPELGKLFEAVAIGADMQPVPGGDPEAIAWVRVHKLPDFVHFDHRPHVLAGVTCQTCHGAVETMERVRQVETLSMGWCVTCHRESNLAGVAGRTVQASTDCAACHY